MQTAGAPLSCRPRHTAGLPVAGEQDVVEQQPSWQSFKKNRYSGGVQHDTDERQLHSHESRGRKTSQRWNRSQRPPAQHFLCETQQLGHGVEQAVEHVPVQDVQAAPAQGTAPDEQAPEQEDEQAAGCGPLDSPACVAAAHTMTMTKANKLVALAMILFSSPATG